MVPVERRPVVDQPDAAVPLEQVGVLGRAVDVGYERVEPHDVSRELAVRHQAGSRREGQRAGQEVHAEVHPLAREQQILDLRVGLGSADHRVELDGNELRHREPERTRELTDHHLGDERLRPLPRAAELQHVEPVVVGLDEPGQRAALAQRGDVAGRSDSAHAGERTGLPSSPGATSPRARLGTVPKTCRTQTRLGTVPRRVSGGHGGSGRAKGLAVAADDSGDGHRTDRSRRRARRRSRPRRCRRPGRRLERQPTRRRSGSRVRARRLAALGVSRRAPARAPRRGAHASSGVCAPRAGQAHRRSWPKSAGRTRSRSPAGACSRGGRGTIAPCRSRVALRSLRRPRRIVPTVLRTS